MWRLKLCETRETSPRLLEHWLHSAHKEPRLRVLLAEREQKVDLLLSHDISSFFLGSQSEETSAPKAIPRFFVHQKKGPLLPIRRYSQFEDRVNKTRIVPLEILLPQLARLPGAFLQMNLRPIKEKQRHRVMKKVKQEWFEPERHFDQWESKGWFRWTWRRLWGPLLRLGLPKPLQKKSSQEEQMESLHEREDPRRAILDKLSRPLFEVEISLSHPFKNFFHSFTLPYLGELTVRKKPAQLILSAEEIATLLTFPNAKTFSSLLHTESTAYLPAHGQNPLHMSEEDRKRHLYLVGKTGMGKSTSLLHFYREDAKKNAGLILMDPHGDLIEEALRQTPEHRHKDILWIDPSDHDYPLALNPLECLPHEDPVLKSSALLEMFETLSKGSWGPRLEYILRSTLLTLVQAPNTTLLDLPPFLTDPRRTRALLNTIQDPELHRFFEEEFLPLEEKTRTEYIAPILNKVGPLLTTPQIRNMFSQPKGKLNWDEALSQNKIILINLAKGKLGEDQSRLLGMVFISMIQSALLRRAALPPEQRKTVCLTIDEFQNFSTKTLISMLSELRKYGLALTLANQYLTQLPPEIQDAVLGNVGSLLCFRTSFQDAQILAPSLGLIEEDLTSLAPFQAYAKLLQEQKPAPLFRWDLSPLPTPTPVEWAALKARSQTQLGRRRSLVEEKIQQRYNKTTKS